MTTTPQPQQQPHQQGQQQPQQAYQQDPGAKEAQAPRPYRRMPLVRRLYSDHTTPIQLLATLQENHPRCFLLESLADPQHRGRYTFLGYQPTLTVTARGTTVTITDENGTVQQVTEEHPRDVIERIVDEHRSPRDPALPPFTGGLVGYLAYDYFAISEPALHLHGKDDEHFNDLDLMLFENVICFDHLTAQILLITNVPVAGSTAGNTAGSTAGNTAGSADSTGDLVSEENRAAGERILDEMEELVFSTRTSPMETLQLDGELVPDKNEAEFSRMVGRAQRHIVEGDIFQVVLSNRFRTTATGSLYDAYRVLRTTNPSPYMFYFTSPDVELIGASPETLVSVHDGLAKTFPLAGTRPRGRTPEEDAALEADLLADPKELAEHHMLVDLGRNDLGRFAAPGTVEVTELAHVHRYSHVMHLGSVVQAQLAPGANVLDAVGSVLPAGTLSGAPKIRTAEIIDELEGVRRGIYGGALGYIDFTGNMDMCIAIRFAYKRGDQVAVRSGAGIVADSIPANEYQETINKATAVVEALQQANGGLSHRAGK